MRTSLCRRATSERVAFEYADAITDIVQGIDDELFARVREHHDEEQIAELTMLIVWEDATSRFNRAACALRGALVT